MPAKKYFTPEERRVATNALARKYYDRRTIEDIHRISLWNHYRLTLDDYQKLLASQGGGCAICGREQEVTPGWKLSVDHDHVTKLVRGILCGHCNRGIGHFMDSPQRLRLAAEYLEAHALMNEALA